MDKHPKRPRDTSQLAKLMVEIAAGEAKEEPKANLSASERGRLGGSKGGKERAKRLSPEERSAFAKKAAKTRWAP